MRVKLTLAGVRNQISCLLFGRQQLLYSLSLSRHVVLHEASHDRNWRGQPWVRKKHNPGDRLRSFMSDQTCSEYASIWQHFFLFGSPGNRSSADVTVLVSWSSHLRCGLRTGTMRCKFCIAAFKTIQTLKVCVFTHFNGGREISENYVVEGGGKEKSAADDPLRKVWSCIFF